MEQPKKEDLRVRKTKKAIRDAFREMICEMDYESLTVKELTERAMINRKTFYLHYRDLDELLEEMQDEIVENFTAHDISYRSLDDIRSIIRIFFEYTTAMPLLNERLLCSGSYRHIGDKIIAAIMSHRAKTNKGAFSDNPLEDSLVFAYFSANSPLLYRQWVADGKKLSVEELIAVATKLICGGLSAYVGG